MIQTTVKQIALHWHRTLGIIMGVVMLMFTLTGIVLIVEKQLPTKEDSWSIVPTPPALSAVELIDLVQTHFFDRHLDWLDLPQHPTQAAQARFKDDRGEFDVYLDPYSGQLLDQIPRNPGMMAIVHKLHGNFLLGKWGSGFVGLSGVGLLAVTLTGLLRWTGWRKFTHGLRLRWSAKPRLLNYDFHNVAGFWVVTFLIMIAITGAVMGFHPLLQHFFKLTPNPEPFIISSAASSAVSSAYPSSQIKLTTVIDQAQVVALPHHHFHRLQLPKTLGDPYILQFDSENHDRIKIKVNLDLDSRYIVRVEKQAQSHRTWKKYFDQLHTGDYGHSWIAWMYVLLAGISAIVSATGLIIGWNRMKVSLKTLR
ncbi:PepSY-associated TM helix domain-containing protein [Alkalinema pantanalense CENA528]|uniref:PepSY-associated TM helix domain-containing protein n=1 Tax=Alkalinema pantanalense TaxID=1620705 RepID=UPI003D6F2F7B